LGADYWLRPTPVARPVIPAVSEPPLHFVGHGGWGERCEPVTERPPTPAQLRHDRDNAGYEQHPARA
jgi:hypothetical protein